MTIKLLCSEAHVARTTFYFHYNNLGEVKEDIEEILLQGLLDIADTSAKGDYSTMDFQQFALKTTEFIDDNRSYFYAFLVEQPDYFFLTQWKKEIKEHFRVVTALSHILLFFKILCQLAPDHLRQYLCTYINVGKIK